MRRTLENCYLIKQCIKLGIGEPRQLKDLDKCEGYCKSEYDDEPCEVCKTCKLCISADED